MELRQYINTVRKRLWVVATIVIIVTFSVGVKSFMFSPPAYQANAKLIVNKADQREGVVTMDYSTIQTNIILINSYKEIIKSSAIMNKVKEKHPELRATPDELSDKVVVSSASNSQVMNLSYVDASYKEAAVTVNAIAEVFSEEIPNIMKVDNVTILNQAFVDGIGRSVGQNPVTSTAIGLIVSLFLSLGLIFLLDYLKNTYRTESEVENDLDIPVLATLEKVSKKQRKKHKLSRKAKVGEGKYVTASQ